MSTAAIIHSRTHCLVRVTWLVQQAGKVQRACCKSPIPRRTQQMNSRAHGAHGSLPWRRHHESVARAWTARRRTCSRKQHQRSLQQRTMTRATRTSASHPAHTRGGTNRHSRCAWTLTRRPQALATQYCGNHWKAWGASGRCSGVQRLLCVQQAHLQPGKKGMRRRNRACLHPLHACTLL